MTDTTTPTHPPRAVRSRFLRRSTAVGAVLVALGVLAAPAIAPSTSTAATLDFPYSNDFATAAGGTLSGTARIQDGRLRLTDDVTRQAGSWSTNDTFPSTLGLEIEFTYSMWTDKADPGADGLLLYLADGAAQPGVGAIGAGLGYACKPEATQGEGPCDLPGVPSGFAAVAFDQYGNFSQPINGSGPGPQPEFVVIRGSGDGTTGYRYVTGARAPGSVVTQGRTPRKVRVTLLPGDDGQLALTVRMEAGGALRTVLDAVPLHGDGQAPLPSTLRLGFAAATGSHFDVHEVDDLRVWKPADLAVDQQLPPAVVAGGPVEYSVTARNSGINDSAPSPLTVDVPEALHDVTWTCVGADGASCATDAGTGDVATDLGLPRGTHATVTVHGTVDPSAAGDLTSVATIEPEPTLADTDEDDNRSEATTPVTTAAQLETEKSVSPASGISPGDTVEYLVTARNRGPGTAQDVGAVDDLPAAVHFAGSDDGCTADGQRVTCRSGAALAPGASVDFHIRAVLDAGYRGDGSDVVNVATATSPTDPDGGDPSPGVSIVVTPGDGGPGDGGPGDGGNGGGGGDGDGDGAGGGNGGGPGDGGAGNGGGPGDGGPGDGGAADGSGGPTSGGAADRDGSAGGAPAAGHRGGALAYTGAGGLGTAGALGGVLLAAGGTCWWVARARGRRAVDPEHAPGRPTAGE